MAYTPDIDQLRKTGICNLDTNYCKGRNFSEILATAKKVFGDAFFVYSSLLYMQKYSLTAADADKKDHTLCIELTSMEHCFGLPFDVVKGPGGIPVREEKAATDYLNFFLYAGAISTDKNWIPSVNIVQFDPNNQEHNNLKNILTESFKIMQNSFIQYTNLGTMMSPDTSVDKILRDAKNALNHLLLPSSKGGIKDKVCAIEPLNQYYMVVLDKMLDIYKNLVYSYKNKMFIYDGSKYIINSSTEFDYEKQLFGIISDIFITNLTEERNKDTNIKKILNGLTNSDSFFSYLLPYKNQIAPFISGDNFEQIMKDYYPKFKNDFYESMIHKFDLTKLGNTVQTNQSVLEHINSNRIINSIEMSDPVIIDLMDSNGDKVFDLWGFVSDCKNPTLSQYLSVIKAYATIDYDDEKIDQDMAEGCKGEIEEFINKHSDLYYKYIAINKDINRIVSNESSSFKNVLPKTKEIIGICNLFIRETSNGPIKLYEDNPYLVVNNNSYEALFDEVYKVKDSIRQDMVKKELREKLEEIRKVAEIKGTFDCDEVRDKLEEVSAYLLDKYGVVLMFNIMLNNPDFCKLLEWEFYSKLLPHDRDSKSRVEQLNDLLGIPFTGDINSEDIKDYLTKVWHTVSPKLSSDAITRTILWDKLILKANGISQIDDELFFTSNIRKGVAEVLGEYKYDSTTSQLSFKSEDNIRERDVGYIIEIPTKKNMATLLYVRHDFCNSLILIPEHILINRKTAVVAVDMPVYDNGTQTYSVRKIPLAKLSLVGYVELPDGINSKSLRARHLVTDQELPSRNQENIYLIVAEDKTIRTIRRRKKENREIAKIIRSLITYEVDGVRLFSETDIAFAFSNSVYSRNK